MSVSDETGQVKWISVHVLKVPSKFSNKMFILIVGSFGLFVTSHIGLFITGSFTHFVISHIGSLALWVSWAAHTNTAKQSKAFTAICTLMFPCVSL